MQQAQQGAGGAADTAHPAAKGVQGISVRTSLDKVIAAALMEMFSHQMAGHPLRMVRGCHGGCTSDMASACSCTCWALPFGSYLSCDHPLTQSHSREF